MTNFPELDLAARRFFWRIQIADSLNLPEYAGSMLRGAFGHALRRIACVTHQQNCTGCSLRYSCGYSYLLETPVPSEMTVMRKYPAAPHPFVIEAPLGGQRLAPGDVLEFSMVVIGRALRFLPLIVLAWQRVSREGLGARRVPGTLIAYREEGDAQWREPGDFATLSEDPIPRQKLSAKTVILHFLTPYRSRQDGRLIRPEALRFRDFWSHLQRRAGLLQTFHGSNTAWDWDYIAALDIAAQIAWKPNEAHWLDWTRYSSRQDQTMQLGGILGRYEIPAESLGALWPLLYLGQWLHVGKNASFGLGRYQLH